MPYNLPDKGGHFGPFGGVFVAETLILPLQELEAQYQEIKKDQFFLQGLAASLIKYAGRPSPLYYAENLTRHLGGANVYLKREDLNHTGSHKINNTIGQALLAKRMGKKRIIAETGAGQHGVAAATACALFDMQCVVYMGEDDVKRQALNVFRMGLLGAEVKPVKTGSKTLKDAVNEALRDWVSNIRDSYYMIGSVVGPHPYPAMVRDFQAVIGKELKKQFVEAAGSLPNVIVACVGGGSNAMGVFYPFLEDREVKLIGVEAGGLGLNSGSHAAPLNNGYPGVLHGALSYLVQDENGQITPVHSISAGLDYPGVGPEHSFLKDAGRVEYAAVTDNEALEAFSLLSKTEGIIPALESAHAVAYVMRHIAEFPEDNTIVINISGRGDKDVEQVLAMEGDCKHAQQDC